MKHELPPLPFKPDGLEPFISQKTIEFHYGKHHQAYVNNLNKLIPGTEFAEVSLEVIVKKATGGIFNNGAQVWNHSFYWNCLSPSGGGSPDGVLRDKIYSAFGSFEEFKSKFSHAAATLFGSGWVWLVKSPDGELEIIQESNAGNPMRSGYVPLLTCDVWEHAYYLDKQNKRPDYINDFWEIVDWKKISERI
ncbi:MAG: superoxide dismutase [Bacteroidales bacterium]|nr:superoxide dismutase [Bacteroidales bacterium]